MNKILIKLYVPTIGSQYDSSSSNVHTIIELIVKGLKELTDEQYDPDTLPNLYNKITGIQYSPELTIEKTNIVNGAELILI